MAKDKRTNRPQAAQAASPSRPELEHVLYNYEVLRVLKVAGVRDVIYVICHRLFTTRLFI